MYENIFLTGFVIVTLMIIIPKAVGDDVPTWLKAIVVIPGIAGLIAMILAVIMMIWEN